MFAVGMTAAGISEHNEAMRVLDGEMDNPGDFGAGGNGPGRGGGRRNPGGSGDDGHPLGWLSQSQLDEVRALVPMAYVEIVPVHLDDMGRVTEVGSLTRVVDDPMVPAGPSARRGEDGDGPEASDDDDSGVPSASGVSGAPGSARPCLTRALVTGRVRYGETIRQAIARVIGHDLGSMALPVIPSSLNPFQVAEFFPSDMAALRDSRQHAIALCYVVNMTGDCEPQNDALDLEWTDPTKMDDVYYRGFVNGHDRIVRAAMAWAGTSMWN